MKTSFIKFLSFFLFLATVLTFSSCVDTDEMETTEALIEETVDMPYITDDGGITLRTDCDGDDVHWGYDDINWDDLCSSWACGGMTQSPINIIPPMTSSPSKYLTFDWDPSGTHIINNGHTIQFNYSGDSKLHLQGGTFKLLQFHFHTDSEHTVNGEDSPAEVHFVHLNETTGKLAVVGVFIDTEGVKDGRPFFNRFLANMPLDEDADDYVDAADLFRADMLMPDSYNKWGKQRFWYYSGSLTTPPCSEIVSWMVMKDKVWATQEQLDDLTDLLTHNGHGNYRPAQPLFSRVVKSHGPILPFFN